MRIRVVTLLAIGSLLAACGGGGGTESLAEPSPVPAAPTVTEPPTTTALPATTDSATAASSTAVPAPANALPDVTTTSAPASAVGDLRSFGEERAHGGTALGSVTWYTSTRIPPGVLEEDFPGPGYKFTSEFKTVYASAPPGVEIYETTAGYLGLSAGEPAEKFWLERELGLGSRWVHSWYAWLFPSNVWFSADGSEWASLAEAVFASGALVLATDPFVVAEHAGTWMIIGGADAPDDFADPETGAKTVVTEDPPRELTPAVWTSSDAASWDRVDFDFGTPGMHTRLQAVAASERGWVVFGVRASHWTPRVTEWAGWMSADGVAWEEIPMIDLLDGPACREARPWKCARIRAVFTDDLLVIYAWEWDVPIYDLRAGTWTALIGAFDE